MARGRRLAGGVALGVLSGLLGGCYTYRPLATAPAPDTDLALELNDRGRIEAGAQVGPAATLVEGTLLQATDTGYVLRVSAVEGISGGRQRWGGEVVVFRADYVASVRERRFSAGRTALAVLGFAGSAIAFIVTRGLGVFGGGDETSGPPGNGNGEQ